MAPELGQLELGELCGAADDSAIFVGGGGGESLALPCGEKIGGRLRLRLRRATGNGRRATRGDSEAEGTTAEAEAIRRGKA